MQTTSIQFLSRRTRRLIVITLFIGVVVTAFESMNFSFTLEGARLSLSNQLSSATGRDVYIDGDVRLTLSIVPEVLIEKVHIVNAEGFDGDFFTISKLRIEVELLPLVIGHLHLSDITADNARLNLIKLEDDRNNWSSETQAQTTAASVPDDPGKVIDSLSLSQLQVTDLAIQYQDKSRNQSIEFDLDQLWLDLTDPASPYAELRGKIQGHPSSAF